MSRTKRWSSGEGLDYVICRLCGRDFKAVAARRHFGGWRAALTAAGIRTKAAKAKRAGTLLRSSLTV